MNITTEEIIYTGAMILMVGGILLLARVAYSQLASFDVEHQLTEADNPAVGTSLFGFMAGVVIVLAAILSTDSSAPTDTAGAMAWDLGETAIYALVSVLLLKLSGWVNDRLILHGFENKKELVTDRNVGAGAVLCGTYIASGLVLAGAFGGRVDPSQLTEGTRWGVLAHELAIAVAFFALGQVVLVLYGQIYQRLLKQDPIKEIEEDYEVDGRQYGGNAAAGMAFGGNLAAVGVLLWGATRGDFVSWTDNLLRFGIVIAVGFVLLPLWRVFVDKVLLGQADMSKEIYEDRNPNAALLETVSVIGLALVIAIMLGPETLV